MSRKYVIAVCMFVALFFVAGIVTAEENEVPMTDVEVAATEVAESDLTPAPLDVVEVGNKICPVTGMLVTELGKFTVEYEGKIYNLCSEACKETFLKDPTVYVDKVAEEIAQVKDAPDAPEAQYSDEKIDIAGEAVEAVGEVK